MDTRIVTFAERKVSELTQAFDGFRTIMLDDWRGYRLIYDILPACRGSDCSHCPLHALLKETSDGPVSTDLILASAEDRRLFGEQKYLNCKSFEQYQRCYVNFLVQKCNTAEEISSELKLVSAMRVLYARDADPAKREREFKRNVVRDTLARVNPEKRSMILDYVASH